VLTAPLPLYKGGPLFCLSKKEAAGFFRPQFVSKKKRCFERPLFATKGPPKFILPPWVKSVNKKARGSSPPLKKRCCHPVAKQRGKKFLSPRGRKSSPLIPKFQKGPPSQCGWTPLIQIKGPPISPFVKIIDPISKKAFLENPTLLPPYLLRKIPLRPKLV